MRWSARWLRSLSVSAAAALLVATSACAQLSFVETTRETLPKIAKIYGAGGIRGLEPYQSGLLVSSDGHILTAFSYVLDTDYITATLHDGSRFDATLIGSDPRLEIAILKIEAIDVEHFDLAQAVKLNVGQRVLAFSNLYGIATGNEPASVQHGQVSALSQLSARKGTFQTPYNGPVYVLDAMTNNAGAAGGALTDQHGQLAGMLGKELRSADSNTWLNYALPIAELESSVSKIIGGETRVASEEPEDQTKSAAPWTAAIMGIRLVPDLMPRTPPFIEEAIPGSLAAAAGLAPDDLIVYANQEVVRSQRQFYEILLELDREEPLSLVILRDQELLPITLRSQP